jgi:hypothetical protein
MAGRKRPVATSRPDPERLSGAVWDILPREWNRVFGVPRMIEAASVEAALSPHRSIVALRGLITLSAQRGKAEIGRITHRIGRESS